jgi:hypothetical protein
MNVLALEKHPRDALEEAVAWQAAWLSADDLTTIGSATPVTFHGKHMFLTAEHVIATTELPRLTITFRPPNALQRREVTSRVEFGSQVKLAQKFRVTSVARDTENDLAVLFVDPSEFSDKNVRFYPIAGASRVPPLRQPVLCIGAQDDSRVQVAPRAVAYQALILWATVTATKHKGAALKDFDPKRDFLVTFGPAKLNRRPHGFSGAGVWRFFRQPTGVWSPKPVLAGVCVGYYETPRSLSCVRMSAVIRFLKHACPSRLKDVP